MRTRRPEPPPRPRRDPHADTQQGPYATAPHTGWARGRASRSGQPGQRYLREGRGARHLLLPGRAAGRTARPASSAAAAPFLLFSSGHGPPRVSRGGALAAGKGGRRARPAVSPSPRAGQGRAARRPARYGPGGCRWQEGGDWGRGAGRQRAGLVVVRSGGP